MLLLDVQIAVIILLSRGIALVIFILVKIIHIAVAIHYSGCSAFRGLFCFLTKGTDGLDL